MYEERGVDWTMWRERQPKEHFRPNSFYFAVPTELAELAQERLIGLPYGVFDINQLKVVKSARALHADPHSRSAIFDLFNRSCVMRKDADNLLAASRYSLLHRLAEMYELEPDTPGYLRLMNYGKKIIEGVGSELAANEQ